MTDTLHTPTMQPKSSAASWLVLAFGTIVTFVAGAVAQLMAYVVFGLCTEADQAACAPGTLPTTWQWILATVPSYLLWVAPSVIAGVLGYRVLQSGNRAGGVVMVVAAILAVLITIACTAMWWL
ncbi:MAG: hypothetical protein WAN48_05650 [Actinomycetes bacterium]